MNRQEIIETFNLEELEAFKSNDRLAQDSIIGLVTGYGHGTPEESAATDARCKQYEEERQREREEGMKLLIKNSNLPEKYNPAVKAYNKGYNTTFSNAANYLVNNLHEKHKSLFVCGPSGTGKSHFVCYLGYLLLEHLQEIYYINIPTFFDLAQIGINDSHARQRVEIIKRRAGRAKYLIVDDLGKYGKYTIDGIQLSYFGKDIYNIYDARRDKNLTTFTTSEYIFESGELEKILSSSIMNRIDYNCIVVESGKNKFREF